MIRKAERSVCGDGSGALSYGEEVLDVKKELW